MKIFYCDLFAYPLPPEHRFPAKKYGLLRAQVAAKLVPPGQLSVPEAASDEQILRAHDAGYLERVATGQLTLKESRRIGLPWSPELVERSRRAAGGTIGACRAALADGVAVNLSGGTHHAFGDHGEGFCVFNDCAIAARALQAERRVRRVAIVDCDVHQGNGTAAIFSGDTTVFTFSIHGAKNFPFHKEHSDLDLELDDGTEDAAYLAALRRGLEHVRGEGGVDLAIYLAGADPYAGDSLGRLSVSSAGLAERDRMVFEVCRQAGWPVAAVMAGGYGRRIQDTVDIHFETVRIALETANR